MNLLQYAAYLAKLSRASEWLDKLFVVVISMLLLIVLQDDPQAHIWLIPLSAAYTFCLANFGYLLNSLSDREQDRLAGKNQIELDKYPRLPEAIIAISAFVAFLILLFSGHKLSLLLGLTNMLLVAAYSNKRIRLKERGPVGVLIGAISQRALPFLVFASIVQPVPDITWYLSAWMTLLGIQMMLVHQMEDFNNDRFAAVSTWAQSLGLAATIRVTAFATLLTNLTTMLALILFPVQQALVALTVILMLSARPMLRTGQAITVAKKSRSLEPALLDLATEKLGTLPTVADHITKGRQFLITRLRRGQLCTRASDSCPHKHWDWKGEPYLALNLILALGEQLHEQDKQVLRQRLLSHQIDGCWDYANGGRGVDVDTSAAAIRALDRLDASVSLSGIETFFDSKTGLYNTFRVDPASGGLNLPPQSRENHLGAHPCVLANVWLLLQERGQLNDIPENLLEEIQSQDGQWVSYFYNSPFYATRLFCELLSAAENRHTNSLEKTLQHLLTADLPSSPTQTAEILIALFYLLKYFPAEQVSITSRAQQLIKKLQQAQLGDGSWEGEIVWWYVHKKHPEPVDAMDCFRVHGTSLAVHALDLWNPLALPKNP